MTVQHPFTAEDVDAGAEALRQLEQGGKKLTVWRDLPNTTKNKWRAKAKAVLLAAVFCRVES